MLQRYRIVPAIFRRYWTDYPDKPLVVLPSTYYFPTEPPAEGLSSRTAMVELFCRDPVSYEHLVQECKLPSCCRVELSHDSAFALRDTPFLAALQGRPGQHILIVERDDTEHTNRFELGQRRTSWRRYVPRFLKKPFYPLRAYLASRRITSFRQRCEAILHEQHQDQSRLPRLVRDVSRRDYNAFGSFCDAIAEAEIVFTTRLHVGILAALLKKQTYLFAGPYHKIRAIYDHSLTGYDNVHLITDDHEPVS